MSYAEYLSSRCTMIQGESSQTVEVTKHFQLQDQKLDSIPLPLDNLFCSMYYSGVI